MANIQHAHTYTHKKAMHARFKAKQEFWRKYNSILLDYRVVWRSIMCQSRHVQWVRLNDALSFSLFCQPVLKSSPLEAQCCSALFFCHHNCLIHPLFIIDFRNSTVLHCQGPYWAMLLGKNPDCDTKNRVRTKNTSYKQKEMCSPQQTCMYKQKQKTGYLNMHCTKWHKNTLNTASGQTDRICLLRVKHLNRSFLDQTNLKRERERKQHCFAFFLK